MTPAGTCFQLVAFKGAGAGQTNVLCGVPGVSTLSSLGSGEAFLTSLVRDVEARFAGFSALPMPLLESLAR
ncbi:MAG: hypothetical protein EXR52_01895 [Dehalococcoidia bacterium]|nr:hypothetical protein [Dehalococcoidia bacterium]